MGGVRVRVLLLIGRDVIRIDRDSRSLIEIIQTVLIEANSNTLWLNM